MYATVGTEVPAGPEWTFEPKYDGMRVLAYVDGTEVRLITRNGRDKTEQFPEVEEALAALGRRRSHPLILDGEVVALAERGGGSFQALQGRMHLRNRAEVERQARDAPAALVVFDVLLAGGRTLVAEPWTTRRRHLVRAIGRVAQERIRVAETTPDSRAMLARARRLGWEGVIAKRTTARYVPGARSRDWLKLKLQHRAEFVVGGYTEPRNSRAHFGAVLLGYFDGEGRLVYVGHTGGGFTRAGLEALHQRLVALERPRSPFLHPPRTNERAHWVAPEIVVEVKFAEWTADGKLRQPIFLGVRDDKAAAEVRREAPSLQPRGRRR